MTGEILDLIVIMTAPDDQLVEVDLACLVQRDYLVAENAQAGKQYTNVVVYQSQRVCHAAAIAAKLIGRVKNVVRLVEQHHAARRMARNIVVIQHDTAEIELISFADAGKVIFRYGLVVRIGQCHRNIFFVNVDLTACLNKIAKLRGMVRMTMRNVHIDVLCTCQLFAVFIQIIGTCRRHACVDQQSALGALDQIHLIAVVINDAPDLHTVHIVHQTALMLHLGHAVDYVSKSYNIAVLHACLGGIGLQLYLGLLCLAVPVITGICADGDEFFHFCAASAGGSLELGLIKNLRSCRSLGIRTVHRILDLRALGIREQRHILRYREGTRCIRIKRISIVIIICVGIRFFNLIAVFLSDFQRVTLAVRTVLCRYLDDKTRAAASQLAHISLARLCGFAVNSDLRAGGSCGRNDLDRSRLLVHLSDKAGGVLAGRLSAVRRVLPVYIDAEIRVVPKQVALLALLVYGQVGQVCNLVLITVAVAVGQIILLVNVNADPVDVLQAVADYDSLGVFQISLIAVQRAQSRGRSVPAFVNDLLHRRLKIVQIACRAVQYNVVVTGEDALYRAEAVNALQRDLKRGQVNVHRVREERRGQVCELHPERVRDVCAVVADLVGREQVAGRGIEQHDACHLVSRQLDYIKFRAAHVVNVTVFQRFQLCIIGCACSGLICEHAGGYAKLLDIITQHLNTALVDINLSAQILVFLAQELMRHLHVIRVRVADDKVDRLACADDLSCGLVQVCRVLCIKVAGIQNHCAVGAFYQIHLVAVVILNERYVRNVAAVPVLRYANLQFVVRDAGNIVVPVRYTAGPAVFHRDCLNVIGLGDRAFRACGRLGDLDLTILIGIELFACCGRDSCLVCAFRDLIINVRVVLCGQRDEIGHVVIEYAQALGGLLTLGERICARCRGRRRAAARRTAGGAARAAGRQSRVVNLDHLAGDFAAGRLDFAGLSAENDRAAQLRLVQRHAGGLDDDNAGALGRYRAGLGDVIRNHVVE